MLFKIYSSSAGSGKTYLLSKEYLKLALRDANPLYFKHILAITFTNDAANEMKERIVHTLQVFGFWDRADANTKEKLQPLLSTIAEELQLSEQIICERAGLVFQRLLYHYSDFSVSTIDSFVNMVISAFSQELNLPFYYEVNIKTEKLIKTAIDQLIDQVGTQGKEALSKLMVHWAFQKIEDGKNWSKIAADLANFAQNDLSNERSIPFVDEIKNLKMEDFLDLEKNIKEYINKIETEIKTFAQKALDHMKDNDVKVEDFYYKKSGAGGYFERILRGEVLAEMNSYVKKALDEDYWYTAAQGKTSAAASIDYIKPSLRICLENIQNHQLNQKNNYVLAKQLLKEFYKLSLIQAIHEEMQIVQQETSTLPISETNKKIFEVVSTQTVPFIYERVGQKYYHILIDEFQDTSVLQWLNLLPLIENSISEAHENLIVGDSKQAIYRWRGGEMEQLMYLFKKDLKPLIDNAPQQNTRDLEDRYRNIMPYHQAEQLKYNYRSTQEVIQFNNSFFETILERKKGEFPLLSSIYEDNIFQEIPPHSTKEGGHVAFDFVSLDPETYQDEICQTLLMNIQEALDAGFGYKDMVIICRKNMQSQSIAQFLTQNHIPILSQAALSLASDEAVCFLCAILKVVNHPNDRLSKSEALYLFYKVIQKIIPDEDINENIKALLDQPIQSFFEQFREAGFGLDYAQLQQLTLYELVEKLIEIFDIFNTQHDLAYIYRFLDYVLEYSLFQSNHLTEFLQDWSEQKHKIFISMPKDANAIVLTSIHRSKGLEFPVVFIPFADWIWNQAENIWVTLPENNELFEWNNTEGKSKVLKSSLVSVSKNNLETELAPQLKSEQEKAFVENLNLLYVAFTRAIYRLYIIAKHPKFDDGRGRSVNYLMMQYLNSTEDNKYYEEKSKYILYRGRPFQKNTSDKKQADVFYVQQSFSTDVHRKFKV